MSCRNISISSEEEKMIRTGDKWLPFFRERLLEPVRVNLNTFLTSEISVYDHLLHHIVNGGSQSSGKVTAQ